MLGRRGKSWPAGDLGHDLLARGVAIVVLLLGLSVLGPAPVHAAKPLGELEEPGQVERAPAGEKESSAPPDPAKPDADSSGSAEKAEKSDDGEASDESEPKEAVTILPDSEAVDQTIEETPDDGDVDSAESKDDATAADEADPPRSDPNWSIRWQNAFIVQRVDDPEYQFLFGGRIQNDWGFYQPDQDLKDSFGGQGTGIKFRRARLYFQGQFFRYGFFKAEYDFSDGSDGTRFADVYLGMNFPKIGLLRVGYFKEPFSLDFLNNSNFISFNERAGTVVFSPLRNAGIMLNGNFLIRDSTYAIAIMRRTDDIGEGFSSKQDYHATIRVTGLPYFEEGGSRLMHIELAYSHQFADKNEGTRYAQAPANDFAPTLVDTGELPVANVDLFNAGFAIVEGSFSLQSEFTLTLPHGSISENPIFWGAYAEVSWWVTGEHRRYLRGRGVFSRVVPNHRFDPEKNAWGAVELATRYSWIDLSNDGIRGGTLGEWSVAINWSPFSNLRVSNNYVLSQTGDRAGSGNESGIAHSWVTRFQVDF